MDSVGVRGGGIGCRRGTQPHPSSSHPEAGHPQGSGFHFKILSLAGLLRGSFLRGQEMEREGRRSQRLSPGPAQAGMGRIFEIKNQLACTLVCGESLPLDEGEDGWVCKIGVGGGGYPPVPGP